MASKTRQTQSLRNKLAARAGALALATATLGAAGCDWSLSFEQNMLDLAEDLLCPGCKVDKEGSAGAGGGAAAGGGESNPSQGDEAEGSPMSEGRAIITIGGRTWVIDGLVALPSTGDPNGATVALVAALNLSGARGDAVIGLPRGEWPLKDDGTPWTFSAGDAPEKREGVVGLELGGKRYTLEFVSSTARVDMTARGPRIRGSVEAHAKPESASSGAQSNPQLVKVSFDLPAD